MAHLLRKKAFLSSLVFFSLLFLITCSSQQPNFSKSNLEKILNAFHDPNSSTVLVAAHRAAHEQFPENSIPAIKRAIEIGADIVEMDARATKDGVIILMHDSAVDRTTNGKGKVKNLTFEQIQQLDLKANDSDKTFKVPTLKQALLTIKNNIMVDIDIKAAPIKKLVSLVHETGTGQQVIFFTRNFSKLDSVLALDSTLMVMPRAKSAQEVPDILARYRPPVLHIDDSFFTPEVVGQIKKSGARVWINALGRADIKAMMGLKEKAYMPLIEGGGNILQTDRPNTLLSFLREKQLHW